MNNDDQFENESSPEGAGPEAQNERTPGPGSGSIVDQATQAFGGVAGEASSGGGLADQVRQGIGGVTGGGPSDSGGGLIDKAKGLLGGLSGGDAPGNSDGSGEGVTGRNPTGRDEPTQ